MPKNRVCYFHDAETIGSFYYGPGHPMKPHRLQMTHNLVLAYGLYKKMQCFRPHLATDEELVQFHAEDYVDFIRRVTTTRPTAKRCRSSRWARTARSSTGCTTTAACTRAARSTAR